MEKFTSTKKIFIIVGIVFFLSALYLVYRSILVKPDINQISVKPTSTYKPKATSLPKPGCYYKQVNCFKAPCEPILVCP